MSRRTLAEKFAATALARGHTGGAVCRTCSFRDRAALEAECKSWNKLRQDKVTSAPWSAFHRVLQRELKYPVRSYKTLLRHLKECLGWTIH